MRKLYLGQRFIDYQGRMFTITDLYSSDRNWEDDKMTIIFELENGNIHLQGKANDAEILKIGFVDDAGEKRTVITVEETEIYVTKKLIKFE